MTNSIFCDKVVLILLTERPDVGVYVKHLPGYVVHNADDMDGFMALGQKKREQTIQDFPLRRFFGLNWMFATLLIYFFLSFFKSGSVGTTNMNEHSSRSHAIFTITIECSETGMNQVMHVGKLHLVDLAVCNKVLDSK